MLDGQLIVVAHDEVVFHIKRGQRFAERGIERIYGFAQVRSLVLRFAEGVSGEHGEASGGVAQSDLQCVVVRVADGGLIGIAAEVRAERAASAVENLARGGGVLRIFAKRAARGLSRCEIGGVAQKQAESWVAWVRFLDHEKAMPLRADVIQTEDGVINQAALEREHVFLGVRNAIGSPIVGEAGNGLELRPIYIRVGILGAGIQRSERDWKGLAEILTAGCGDEGSGEERRRGAGVGGAVGSVRAHYADGDTFDRGVEHSVTGADAGPAGAPKYFREQAVAGDVG